MCLLWLFGFYMEGLISGTIRHRNASMKGLAHVFNLQQPLMKKSSELYYVSIITHIIVPGKSISKKEKNKTVKRHVLLCADIQ